MTIRLLRTLTIALAALLSATALAACGSNNQPTQHGESEGDYVKAGPLVYQVQLSRELNPGNVEDRQYLAGLPSGTAKPAGDEEWFGVWLRVQNPTDRSALDASELKIVDTLGNVYRPIPLPKTNVFSYQPRNLPGTSGQPIEPDPSSIAGSGPIQGAMVLFKLKTSVYSNRPLELEISPPGGGAPSTVSLDL
jgi:hypothetical protein